MLLPVSAIHFERSVARNSCKMCDPFSARSSSALIRFAPEARLPTWFGLLPLLAWRRFLRFSFRKSERSSNDSNVKGMEMEASSTRRAGVPVAEGEDVGAEVAEEGVVEVVGAKS